MYASLSRTEHVVKNATYGIVAHLVSMLLQFVGRTVFIYVLGKAYLGVHGLFANVLLILSFAELGFADAMIYSLYRPLKEHDEERLKSLLQLYRRAYRVIGLVVAIIGLALVPFLRFIINDTNVEITDNITVIYLLYLAGSVISYFFVYKQSVIIADQNSHVKIFYTQAFNAVQVLLQIAVLLAWGSFIGYIVVGLVCGVACNYALSLKADTMYPFLRQSNAAHLPGTEIKKIVKNVKALTVYKFASVVLNGTDNIILSVMFGVGVVGANSNYVLILLFFSMLFSKITSAFTASIGNLNTGKDAQKQYAVFRQLFFICTWLYGFVSIGVLLMHGEVIALWIGDDYVFDFSIVLAIIVHFYINAVSFAGYTYRITTGLFVQGQIAPAVAAVLNIVLSIALARVMGIAGVFWATVIARLLTMCTVDPILVYRKVLHVNPVHYALMYAKFALIQVGLFFLCRYAISVITLNGIVGVALKCLTIAVLYNVVMWLLTARSNEFKELKLKAEQYYLLHKFTGA